MTGYQIKSLYKVLRRGAWDKGCTDIIIEYIAELLNTLPSYTTSKIFFSLTNYMDGFDWHTKKLIDIG